MGSPEGHPDLAYGTLCSLLFGRTAASRVPWTALPISLPTLGSEWDWGCFGGVWKKQMRRTFNEVLVRCEHFHIPTFY